MNRFTWEPEDLEITHEDGIVIPTDVEALAARAKIADGPLPESAPSTGTVSDPGPGIRALSPSTPRKSKKLDGILGRHWGKTDEWSDAAREAAAEARRANATRPATASNTSPQEATRRAEYASSLAKKAKGEDRAAAHGRASAMHEIAAEKNPDNAPTHTMRAAMHASEAERISNPGKRAPNAAMYAAPGASSSPLTRRTEPTANGEIIHASHGVSDQSGRAVGGRAMITSGPEGHRVLIQPTRSGNKFGAYGHETTTHPTIEAARAHANAGLDAQRIHFLKKSAEIAARGAK